MIARIKGTLVEIEGNVGVIETTSGLSYEVFLHPSLLSRSVLSPVEVETYLQVRDDAHILFGFENKQQKRLFTLLLTVSGVGPKTAFQIVSYTDTDELITAVQSNDVQFFSKVPGLGKKTSMKIILELSQKLKSEFDMKKMQISEEDKTVIEALASLGYKVHDAKKALSQISDGGSVEDRIKKVLALSLK